VQIKTDKFFKILSSVEKGIWTLARKMTSIILSESESGSGSGLGLDLQ